MSQRENEYSRIVQKKTDEEVKQLLSENEKYIDEFLQAAVWEAENRNITHPLLQQIKENLQKTETIEQVEIKDSIPEVPEVEKTESKSLKLLYSKTAILGFSLFFSPLSGGILLALNAAKVDKKAVLPIVIFTLVFTGVQLYSATIIPRENSLSFIIPVAGALLLSEVLWNQFIGKKTVYEKRSILIPLIIALIIVLPVLYIMYYHPEMLPLPQTK